MFCISYVINITNYIFQITLKWLWMHGLQVRTRQCITHQHIYINIIINTNYVLLEQNVFNITTLSFDDNKVLKSQLDMLIFVQVWRTIDKIFISLKSKYWFWKNKRKQWKFTKEAYVARLSLKTIRVWRFIRSWLPESDVIKSLKTIRVWSQ